MAVGTAVIDDWLQSFNRHRDVNTFDHPNYYVSDPSVLSTACMPLSFSLGTGEQLLSRALYHCGFATQEILIVTCFWAESSSQAMVAELLKDLSAKAVQRGTQIRVCICFSSLSLTQKLFHTASPEGKIWSPSSWQPKFGLPAPQQIPNVDLRVKSVFIRPFSVMHPKFIVIDRKHAFLPSCNVSWEKWFEGCIEFTGPLVGNLVQLYQQFWSALPPLSQQPASIESWVRERAQREEGGMFPIFETPFNIGQIPTLFLPSPHHRDPRFRPWPLPPVAAPPTPLNTCLLSLIRGAKSGIYIQTPNVTAAPVIDALLNALEIGTNVHIVTSSKLMIAEQLVTAGTVTELSIRWMMKRYAALKSRADARIGDDEEALRHRQRIGDLKVEWYRARGAGYHEPVKSHLKLCIVDEEITVLGSGNLDRASWYTSQELGVAFFSREFAERVRDGVRKSLVGRLE